MSDWAEISHENSLVGLTKRQFSGHTFRPKALFPSASATPLRAMPNNRMGGGK
jgi:hypothetical protein